MLHSRTIPRAIPWLVPLTLLILRPVSAEVIGFSADNDVVTELLLGDTGDTIAIGESWAFPSLFPIAALENDVDGTLLALSTQAISADQISRLDLESGTVTVVTSLSVGQRGLALAPSGVVWAFRYDGELRAYDFSTGQIGPRLMIDYASNRAADIAFLDDRLYAIFNGEQLEDGPLLGVIDTSTGAVTELRELVSLRPEPSIQRFVTGLDFDDAGGMWIGYVDSFAIADPPIPMPGVAYLSSPSATVAKIRSLEDDLRGYVPLAVTGSPAITEIPTLNGLAAPLLALLLLAAALTRLRHTS